MLNRIVPEIRLQAASEALRAFCATLYYMIVSIGLKQTAEVPGDTQYEPNNGIIMIISRYVYTDHDHRYRIFRDCPRLPHPMHRILSMPRLVNEASLEGAVHQPGVDSRTALCASLTER